LLIGEPQRTQADLNFRLFGIPVRVHPFFWLIGVLLGPLQSGVREMLIWMVAFFVGILLHEFGHAWTMRAYGFRPWITLYGLGGMASYDHGLAFNSRGSAPARQILISAAGPGAGFVLAALVVAALMATGHSVEYAFGLPYGFIVRPAELVFSLPATLFVDDLLFVTVVYGILNLMPIYPLDGGQISREICLSINPRDGIRQSLILSMVAAAGLALLAATASSWFVVFLFGYLAYSSFAAMQAYTARGPW